MKLFAYLFVLMFAFASVAFGETTVLDDIDGYVSTLDTMATGIVATVGLIVAGYVGIRLFRRLGRAG